MFDNFTKSVQTNSLVNPDPDEVSEYKWVKIEELKKDLKDNPDKYTLWFKIIMEKYEKLANCNEVYNY